LDATSAADTGASRPAAKPSGTVRAHVFVDTESPGPWRVVREIRWLAGVVQADALFGTPDVVASVEGEDLAAMDAVTDRIIEIPGVLDTDSKVVRPIDREGTAGCPAT